MKITKNTTFFLERNTNTVPKNNGSPPRFRFDRLYVSKNNVLLSFDLRGTSKGEQRNYISDHFGVSVELEEKNYSDVAQFVPESKYDYKQFSYALTQLLKGFVKSPNYSDFSSALCLKLSKSLDLDETKKLHTVVNAFEPRFVPSRSTVRFTRARASSNRETTSSLMRSYLNKIN